MVGHASRAAPSTETEDAVDLARGAACARPSSRQTRASPLLDRPLVRLQLAEQEATGVVL
jgi:hypothetical protein